MFDLKQCQSEMEKVIEFFQQAMKSVRTGRAHAPRPGAPLAGRAIILRNLEAVDALGPMKL